MADVVAMVAFCSQLLIFSSINPVSVAYMQIKQYGKERECGVYLWVDKSSDMTVVVNLLAFYTQLLTFFQITENGQSGLLWSYFIFSC